MASTDETSSDEPWDKVKRNASDDNEPCGKKKRMASDDNEPWQEMRRRANTTAKQKRARRPRTPQDQFLSGVAAIARASAKISLSMPGVAGSTTPLAGLATMWQQPGCSGVPVEQQQQTLQQFFGQPQQSDGGSDVLVEPQQSNDDAGLGPVSKRAPRGSAGTFMGRRPPKTPSKLAVFLAKKEVHQKKMEEAREEARQKRSGEQTRPSEQQLKYWEFMRQYLQDNNSTEAFRSGVQQYRMSMMKKPAGSNTHDQQTPKKNKRKPSGEATLTPDKEVPPQSSSASSSTGK